MKEWLLRFFQNPGFLWILVAILIPPIIEWLLRRRRRRIPFAAMRFLLDTERPKKIRLQDRILLILRMVVIALIVLALIRPEDIIAIDRKDRSVIVLFDATYSNAQRVGNVSAFDRAKRMAAEVLDGLPEGVPVTLAAVGHTLKVIQEWTADKGLLREKIEGLSVTHGAGHMRDGLAWAEEKIKGKGSDNRQRRCELFIFSDLQYSTWLKEEEAGTEGTRALMPRLADKTQVFVADTGGSGAANLYVTRFEPEDNILAANVFTRFLVEVKTANLREGASLPARITLFVNEEKRHVETLDIPAGGKDVRIPYRVLSEGEQVFRILLEGDESPMDNERLFLAEVPRAMRLLLLDDEGDRPASERTSVFLQFAMAPPATPGREAVSAFTVHACTWDEAQKENFHDYAAVVLANVRNVPEGLASRLDFYVREGGTLLTFVGEGVEPYPYEALYRRGEGPLPVAFRTRDAVSGFLRPLVPDVGELADGPFLFLRQLIGRGTTEGAFKTLAQLSSGQPVMVCKNHGQGRSAVVAIDPGIKWSRLPLAVNYPVFVQQLLRALIGDPNRLVNLLVGQTFSQPILVSVQHVLLKRPSGEKVRLTPATTAGEDLPRISYSDTDTRGLYHLEAAPGVLNRQRFAVNLSPDESDMTKLSESDFRRHLTRRAIFLSPTENIAKRVGSLYRLREFAGMILFVVFVLLLTESFLAMRFGLRKG